MTKVQEEVRDGVLSGAEAEETREGASARVNRLHAGQDGGKDDRLLLVNLGINQLCNIYIYRCRVVDINMKRH